MIFEGVMTFFLVFVVFATAVDERGAFDKVAGFAIGLTVTMGVLFGGPFTGRGAESRARLWSRAGRQSLDQPRRLLDWPAGRRRCGRLALRHAVSSGRNRARHSACADFALSRSQT